MKKILFVGCGNMGAAILSGIVSSGWSSEIVVVDPNCRRARLRVLKSDALTFTTRMDLLGDFIPDLSVLAIKPDQFALLGSSEIRTLGAGCIVSIMAGISIDRLREALGTDKVARVMPNLPASVRQAMSVGYSGPGMFDLEAREHVATLFGAVGRFIWVDRENEIDLATALAGSGPGYLLAVAESLMAAARSQGMPQPLADMLVRQTFLGTATMLSIDNRSARDLMRAVSSPGGTTEAGLRKLEESGMLSRICEDAVAAAVKRARVLDIQP